MSALRHLQAILALPFTVLVVIPTLLIIPTKEVVSFWEQAFPLNFLFVIVGFSLIASGLILMISTIRLFMTVGHGTLAPWDPTHRLVVLGPYRYVRNPMIIGVICTLLGEAAFFSSRSLFVWALAAIIVNMIYIPLLEEPGLIQRFGKEYEAYMKHVPRWIPRFHPWDNSAAQTAAPPQ
jgi:protein-S-isoprenylcysteine O-methyltransferase Ste14